MGSYTSQKAHAETEPFLHEPMPTRDEALSLVRRWQQEHDAAAREQLARGFMRMVYKHARRYAQGQAWMFEDLVSAGMEGLTMSIERFDPERGNAFSTYAHTAIKNLCNRVVREQTMRKKRMVLARLPSLNSADMFGQTRTYRDPRALSPPDQIVQQEERRRLTVGMRRLPRQGAAVLRLRMLGYTLEDIGTMLGLTRERIRQIEGTSLDNIDMRPSSPS